MEQVVVERPFSQEQGFSQLQMWCNGTLDNDNVHIQPNPSRSQYFRRSTDRDISGINGYNTNEDGKGYRPICRAQFRGSCSRGMSCKFQNAQTAEHDGSSFYRDELQNLGPIADPRNAQFDGQVMVCDPMRPIMRERRSRSPCRKFQMGRCKRGATCPYLHHGFTKFHGENKDGNLMGSSVRKHRSRSPCREFRSGRCERGANCLYLHDEFRIYDSSVSNLKAVQHHCLGPASTQHGLFGRNVKNISRASQGHDSADKANDARVLSFSREPRSRSPRRSFPKGICRFGASCRNGHDQSPAQQPGIVVVSDRPNFVNGSQDTTSREPRSQSPCRKFLKGRCRFGASCRNWHDLSAPQQPGISATSSGPSFGSGSLDMYSREHGLNQHHNMRNESFVRDARSSPCRFFLEGSCNLGASCGHLHPITVYEITRYDKGIQQHQGQGATAISRNYHFREKIVGREDMNHRMHSVNDGAVNDHNRACTMEEQLARNRVHMDVKSSSGSFGRKRRSFARDCGGDNLRPEVCLRFTKGRCDQGESCKYLHSFDEFASSTTQPSKRLCLKPAGDMMNVGHLHQSALTMVAREHNTVNNDKMQSSVHQHIDSGLVVIDYSFDQEAYILSTEEPAADDEIHLSSEQHPLVANDMYNDRYQRIAATSVSLSFNEDDDSNLMASRGHAKFVSCGMQLKQLPVGSHNSDAGILSKKIGVSAANASNPSQPYQNDEKSVTNSTTIEVAEGAAVVGVERMELHSRSSSEEHHISLPDASMSVVEEDDKDELMIHLSKDEIEQTKDILQPMITYSRKKRKRGTNSTCSVEPSTEERTGSSSQKFVTGVSDTMNTIASKSNATSSRKKRKRGTNSACSVEPSTEERTGSSSQKFTASKGNATEDDLVNELPVQWKGNEVVTNNVQNDVESSAATIANRMSLNFERDNNSLAALQSVDAARSSSRRKLLVLDVNGLLADIVADFPDSFRPHITVSGKGVFKRPFYDTFLQFCFAKFDVGIWSSRNKKNVTRVVDFLMKKSKKKLLFCWDQSHCTRTGYKTLENQDKPLVLKELKKLWENKVQKLPWKRGFYNQTNTVLLDDSPYKALCNPPYTAIFPFPYSFKHVEDNSLGPGGDLRLYLERLAEAENVQKFIQENPFGQRAITETNSSWGFYSRIVGKYASQPEEKANGCPDSS